MQRKVKMFVAVLTLVWSLTSCAVQPRTTESNAPEESEPTPAARAVDYVDVLRNSDKYDGEYICVAGQITNFSSTDKYSFYFNDRLGRDEDGIGFEVTISHTPRGQKIYEIYDIGDFVVVEGIWQTGRFKSLREAAVIQFGEEAEKQAMEYLNAWEQERIALAKSAPILNYIEITQNLGNFTEGYIRIAGIVSATGTNKATHHLYFRLRDIYSNHSSLIVSLKGCPQKMQDSCKDGECVILSGQITIGAGSANLVDCYVECVGDQAKEIYDALVSDQSYTFPSQQVTQTPSPTQSQARTWILNTNTMKIHYPSCSSVSKISASNYAESNASIDELLILGYSRCGRCF